MEQRDTWWWTEQRDTWWWTEQRDAWWWTEEVQQAVKKKDFKKLPKC